MTVEDPDHLQPNAADALAAVARLLAESFEPREVAQRIVETVARLLETVAAAVYTLTERGDLVAIALAGDAGADADEAVVFPRGIGLAALAVARGEPVVSDDVLDDPRLVFDPATRARLERAGYRAAAAVPLLVRGRVIGALGVGLRGSHHLGPHARRVVEAFADQAALLLDNARLHAQICTAQRRLDIEHRVARIVAEATTVPQAMARLIGTLAEALGWSVGIFWRVDDAAGVLRAAHVQASPAAPSFETASRGRHVLPGDGVAGQAWATGAPVWIADLARDRGMPEDRGAATDGLRAALAFPVSAGEDTVGVVELLDPQPREPDAELLGSFAAVGGQIGQFIERKRAEAALAGSHRQFKAVFDGALDAVVVADDDRRYVDANAAAASLFGVEREALLGRRLDDFVEVTGDDDPATAWRRFLEQGAQEGEVTLTRPDGERRVVEYRARAHFVPGRHLSILRDVTERRRAELERAAAESRFAVLAEVAQALSQTLDPDVVGQRIVDTARTLLAASAAILYRLSDDGLVIIALSGSTGPGFSRGLVLPKDVGVAGLCIQERQPVATGDLLADSRPVLPPDVRARIDLAAFRSVLAVPLTVKGAVVGAFAIGDVEGRVFDRDEIRVAQAFADQAALALENARIFALESRQRAQMEALAAIERDLTAELEPSRLLALIVEHACRFFHAEGSVFLFAAGRVVERARSSGAPAMEDADVSRGVVGDVATHGRGRLVNDYASSPLAVPAVRALGFRHVMAQPLAVHGRLVGVVVIGRRVPTAASFTSEEFDTLGRLAVQAAIALDNARLYVEAARGQQEAEVIAEVARAINAVLEIDAILPRVAAAARALTGADAASIALRGTDDETLTLRYSAGQVRGRYDEVRITPGIGFGGRIVTTGRAARSDDVRSDIRVDDDGARRFVAVEGIETLLGAPIAFGGRVEGVLFVANRRAVPFTAQDEAVVQRLADHTATALRNVGLLAAEQAARAAAEAANRTKDDFLATVSHELRTPLTAMLGWIWWLRRGAGDETVRQRALETIDRNAKAQAQLVEDLLDVSRIVAGKLRLDVRPADLGDVVRAAIDSVRTAAEAKDITLSVDVGTPGVAVAVDPDRIQQVVWNLLSNAIKFTPSGGRVDIRLEQTAGMVRIAVSDTGAGISAEFLPHVFERFRQAEASSTRTFGGLGLGLAIVRHLVELHGGTVAVASAGEGQGTTFTVTLPVRAVVSIPAGDGAAYRRAKGQTGGTGAMVLDGVRVLLVEDAADTRDLVTAVLAQHGADVTAVPSAADARDAMGRATPDVLVSDIGMRGEDGYALIRSVRSRSDAGRGVPAVALTAYARAEDRRHALRAGYDVHLPKPVDPGDLVAVVADLAARARMAAGARRNPA